MEENNNTPLTVPVSENPVPPVKKQSLKEGVWDFLRFALIVLVVVVGVRYFIAQPFVVSGTSMVPTFENANYLIIDEVTYRFHQPERGDVIVFHPPVDPSMYYIKRVIGVPGDTIIIKDSVVTLKNSQYPDGKVLDEEYITPEGSGDNYAVTVPEGQYFVMGDNRPASFDSRRWGLLPKKNIVGRVIFRLFPFNEMGVLPGKEVIN